MGVGGEKEIADVVDDRISRTGDRGSEDVDADRSGGNCRGCMKAGGRGMGGKGERGEDHDEGFMIPRMNVGKIVMPDPDPPSTFFCRLSGKKMGPGSSPG